MQRIKASGVVGKGIQREERANDNIRVYKPRLVGEVKKCVLMCDQSVTEISSEQS